jgi:pyruvate dehydrogenase E2 component (dihydrolipoamide acetyltransferase)
MAKFYEMPAVSPTMEVGTIVAWRLKEGEKFAPQTVVAEVGTDKANMEAEIFDSGVMIKHLLAEGDEAPAGYPIAIVGQSANEDISALLADFAARRGSAAATPAPKAEAPTPTPAAPTPPPAAAPPAADRSGSLTRSWNGSPLSADFQEPPGDLRYGADRGTTRRVASPLARAVAADLGVDLSRVAGTGPGGRVVREDVEAAARAPKTSAPAPTTPGRADEVVRNSPMRKTIAKRLLQSHQDIPTFFLTVSFDGQGFVTLREQLKARDVKVSYNDILTACVARALRESPKVNASWSEKEITRYGRVDIGVAVALPDGLITPVLRATDTLSLTQIAARTRELVGRAKDGKLDPSEYTGGTFTISNLGMYDIDQFTAIINPPEAAILAVGSLAQVPVAVGGQLAVGWRMKCTLTCDHRVIDGATGAEFLQVLRKYVESPVLLLA